MKSLSPLSTHPSLPQYLQTSADRIIRCVAEGKYCAVLGPRFSGKTELLNFVKEELKQRSKACVSVNLYETEAARQLDFFTSLAKIVAKRVEDATGIVMPLSPEGVTDSAAFRSFTTDGIDALKDDLVLILDHLEGAPNDLIRALLTSLRAVYMEQREAEHQLVIIVAGALNLAGLAIGETSPFRGIAERVLVDLPPDDESKAFAEKYFSEANILVSSTATALLVRAARGDRTLITKLCERCALRVSEKPSKRLSMPLLEKAIREFIANDAPSHAPLQEALRLIESDPDLLTCTLLLAKKGIVHRGQLPLPLSPDIDPFYLTGVIRKVEPDSYQFRNEIYRQFLTQYFNPGRVGHILTMSGRWGQAIEYLEASVKKEDLQYRSDLFAATIHSMYASQNIEQAAEYLTRGLSAGFKIKTCRVWYSPPARKALKFIGGLDKAGKDKPIIGLEISISDERLEARAYRDACTLRGMENNGNVEWAIPLSISDRPPIGVVYAVIHAPDWASAEQREWELELTGYLHQAARAIQEVVMRQEWQNQLETLDQIALDVAGGLQVKHILRTALEKTVGLVGGTGGGIYLLDDSSETFTLEAQYGLSPSLEGVKFENNRGVIGEVRRTKQPFSIRDYFKWSNRQPVFDEYNLTAVVGVPVLSGNILLGVLAIHDQREGQAFQKKDEELLLRVGNHVAVALEHAKAYQSAKEATDYREHLISSSLDGIIAIDTNGYITIYNEGAARICGYSPEEVFQLKPRVDKLYGDLATAQTINRKLHDEGKLENYETSIRGKDGQIVPIVLSAILLKGETGNPIGSVGYFKDLRPLKKVEGELRSVLDVISTVTKSSDLDRSLATLAEKMVIGLNVSFCLILLLDEEKQDLRLKAAYPVQRSNKLEWNPEIGDNLDLKGLPIIECLSKMEAPRAFRRGDVTNAEIIIVDFIQETTGLGTELQSILTIPFRTEQGLFGVCVLGEIRNWERNPFDEKKKRSAASMTDAVTVLIDRLRAQDAMRQRMTLADELRKVSDAVAHLTTEASKAVLDQIAQSICKMVDADCGMIYPYYSDLEIYDVRNIGLHGLLDKEKRYRPKPRMHPESMTRVVLQNTAPIIVDDTDTERDRSGQVNIWAEENKFIKRERIKSFVGLGLWSGQEAVGALFVNFRKHHEATEDELNTINIFANQAAVAIQQSRLYQRGVKDHKVVLSTNKITQLIGSAEALHEVWQAILEGALDVTGADRGRILSMDRLGKLTPEVTLGFDEKSDTRIQNRPYEPCPLVNWVMDNKKPLLISDMVEDSPTIKSLTKCYVEFCPDVKSVLAAPILHSDAQNALGVLVLESADWAAFSAYDKSLMAAFVKYAGIAVQSAERFTEIQQGANLRTELLKAGQSIISLEKSQEVLQSIADSAKTALGCDLVTLYTYDEPGEEIGFLPTISGELKHRLALQKLGYVSKQSVVWKILKAGELYFAVDSLHDKRMLSDATARHKGFKPFVEREGIRSSAGIPLLVGDKKVGILFVNYRTPHPFSEDEQKNILLFATQAAIAIQNARSYKNLIQLKSLYDAARVAGLDRKQLLDEILELAISITSASGGKATLGTIQIIDEQTNEREFTNVYPLSEYAKLRTKIGHRLSLDRTKTKDGRIGITGRTAIEKKPQLVLNVKKDSDYIEYSTDTRAELAVPLIDDDRVIGVLNVESDKINAFDTSDRDALIALADLTMTALRNQDHMRRLGRANAVAMMGAWGADVVHDVKKEVGNIRRTAFLLQRDFNLTSEAHEKVQDIDHYAEELASLPTQPPKPGEGFLGDVSPIDDVVQAEVSEWQQRYTDIAMLFDGHCEGIKVAMHKQWIRRLLRHLIRNALNAIPQENATRRVIVQTKKSNKKVEVTVEDTGNGIRSELIPKLFVEPISHEDGREGQGLLLVGFVVEQYGGKAGVKWNRPGKGACIYFSIPVA